jgi:uncharacterized membrane protein
MEITSIIAGTAGITLLVLIPGLSVSLALFPKKDELDAVERLGFSFVFGLLPQLIQYFLDKNMNVPITASTTLGIIAFVTAAGLAAWKLRSK